MLDNVEHVHDFIQSTRRLCSLLGGWVSGLISKPYRKVGSEFDDSMDEYINISSSDDDDFDLEEIEDPRRTLPQWATTERNSDYGGRAGQGSSSRGANSSNTSSSNVYNHSQVKPQTKPVPSRSMPNHGVVGTGHPSYHTHNGSASQPQTFNYRNFNNSADYERLSSQQAIKGTLPPSFQSSATRAHPSSSFAPDSRLSNLKMLDNISSRPSTSSDKGYTRVNLRGTDEDRFMHQNGGIRNLPSSMMLGKAINPMFASSSEPPNRYGAVDERDPGTDERLIFEAALEDLHQFQHRKEADLPAGVMSVSLMRHQKIALAWMVQKETKSLHCWGGILADDQGLGKTISMTALILMQRQLQSKWKADDTGNHKTEALNLDDEDDNGVVDVEKLENIGVEKLEKIEDFDDVKPSIEPSSSTLALSRRRPAAGTLVVCPASVLRQWARELDEKVGDDKLSVLVYHGGNRTKDHVELAKFDVVLTTYALVTNEVPKQPLVDEEDDEKNGEKFGVSPEFFGGKKRKKPVNGKKSKKGRNGIDSSFDCGSGPLARVGWFRVILDEAQTIKNHRTQVARACCSLRAKRRWCLSGTPIQNTIDDLYSYFRFLKYDPYAVYKSFYNTIKVPISRNSVQGYKKLQAVLRAVMLRRTKGNIPPNLAVHVLTGKVVCLPVPIQGTLIDGKPIVDLPPKTIELAKVDFSIEERSFYKKLEADSRSQFKAYAAAGTVNQNYANILLMLLRLRQACDHPRLVKDYNSNSNPVSKDSIEMAKTLPKEMLLNLFNRMETTFAICGSCEDTPDDPVVTMCGHVFCYQCVSEYLTGDDNLCPANGCKEQLGEDLVFSKETLRSCLSDELGGSSTANSDPFDYESVQKADYESSKIKAVLEVLQSNCKLKTPSSDGSGDSLSSDSLFEDCDSDVKVTKHTRKYSESTTERPIKAIIFSQWTSMLDLVEASLKQSHIRYRRLDGRMSLLARDKAVKDFNTKNEITVMLMSLKAGNLGLNMVAACHVILLDLWWNPTTEDQAIDRAHRIGQTRPVTVTRITIKDTVEDRILALQEEKKKMVASAFGEDHAGGSATRLTVEDLKYLFMGGV